MSQDRDDKQFEPTQKKLDDARKKGEIPRSADLNMALAYAGFLIVALLLGRSILIGVAEKGMVLLGQADTLSGRPDPTASGWASDLFVWSLGTGILPVFLVPMALVLTGLFAQRALVFAPSKLAPKLSRISPLENAKNKYGRSGLFEFAKSFTKLMVISLVLAIFIWSRIDGIASAMSYSPDGVAVLLGRFAIQFLAILVAIAMVIGVIDLAWQTAEHRRRNMMSQKELRDEAKDSEGDPHMKAARRQRGQEIAMSSMLADVAESSVVIVNPKHYAVALKWDPSYPGPPVCVAKGVDEIAARIREAANENGVPIHRDPPTARALHASVEIGGEIASDQFQAVAAAIRFADQMRALARRRVTD